jgi:21S rRNA (uridine2791-2'-O)-methyltransferase
VERTKPGGRIVGIDIIPAQPPKGVSTIQGNFLSKEVQAEVKRFLSDPERGRPREEVYYGTEGEIAFTRGTQEQESYIDMERHQDENTPAAPSVLIHRTTERKMDKTGYMVDIVLSDMCEPWQQTEGFWKRSLSDPYIRMMNTSGINFKDHAGSMVRTPIETSLWSESRIRQCSLI